MTVFLLHVLVGPLGGDGVLMEESWGPGFVSPLPGLLPLSFLQHKLLLGGPVLVPVQDGSGHMLPQSVEGTLRKVNKYIKYLSLTKVSGEFVTDFFLRNRNNLLEINVILNNVDIYKMLFNSVLRL